MSFLFHFLRKYPFSMICIAMIWILSLVPFFPETPLDNVEFIDKWVHILMYGCSFIVVWIEYTRKHKQADYEKMFFWGWLAPILMSGTIELIQEYCTGGRRSGDWFDLAANATGVTLAAVIGLIIWSLRPKR
jgi:Na+/melibiose symporter-like transporter